MRSYRQVHEVKFIVMYFTTNVTPFHILKVFWFVLCVKMSRFSGPMYTKAWSDLMLTWLETKLLNPKVLKNIVRVEFSGLENTISRIHTMRLIGNHKLVEAQRVSKQLFRMWTNCGLWQSKQWWINKRRPHAVKGFV